MHPFKTVVILSPPLPREFSVAANISVCRFRRASKGPVAHDTPFHMPHSAGWKSLNTSQARGFVSILDLDAALHMHFRATAELDIYFPHGCWESTGRNFTEHRTSHLVSSHRHSIHPPAFLPDPASILGKRATGVPGTTCTGATPATPATLRLAQTRARSPSGNLCSPLPNAHPFNAAAFVSSLAPTRLSQAPRPGLQIVRRGP
jgi:hypothetical protein